MTIENVVSIIFMDYLTIMKMFVKSNIKINEKLIAILNSTYNTIKLVPYSDWINYSNNYLSLLNMLISSQQEQLQLQMLNQTTNLILNQSKSSNNAKMQVYQNLV